MSETCTTHDRQKAAHVCAECLGDMFEFARFCRELTQFFEDEAAGKFDRPAETATEATPPPAAKKRPARRAPKKGNES